MTPIQKQRLAMGAVAYSGFVWGLFWIPLRAMDAVGISGTWAVLTFHLLPTILLTPVFIWRWRKMVFGGASLHLSGLLAGGALVLYSGALIYTDVVRALLFYYLTPVWSTLLARLILGEAITRHRWVTIALGMVGLLLILRLDEGFAAALGPGDIMGLASGVVWALAAVTMHSHDEAHAPDFALSYFLWGSVVAFGLTLLPLDGGGSAPDMQAIWSNLYWILPVLILLVMPPTFAVMWGATLISPGLLAILFMTEVSSGTVTAAIWADEPFGLRELCGVLVITAAGLWEPVRDLRRGAA